MMTTVLQRKALRKGTHSCVECRRRKVKCLFESRGDIICINCVRRKTQCTPQTNTASHANISPLRGRDLKTVTTGPDGDLSPLETERRLNKAQSESNSCLEDCSLAASKASISDNEVEVSEESMIEKRVRLALLTSIPSQEDLQILMSKVSPILFLRYHPLQRACGSSNILSQQAKDPFADFLSPTSSTITLARQMLQLASALRCLSPREVLPGLSNHHHLIMTSLAESAINNVTTNDSLCGTIEQLDSIVLESLYHIDCGNIRGSWLSIRRALTVAQLLSLQHSSQRRSRITEGHTKVDPEMLWTSIVTIECGQSLLLGLPSSTVGLDMESSTLANDIPDLIKLMTRVTYDILQRNQTQFLDQALEMTRAIDRDLVEIAKKTAPEFWCIPVSLGVLYSMETAYSHSHRLWDHICYYTLVIQNHLPYMLPRNDMKQNYHSKISCVSASRDVLTRTNAIHALDCIVACSRMGDFMVLVATMTLMIAHIVSTTNKDNLFVHHRLSDRGLVAQVLECLDSAASFRTDSAICRYVDVTTKLLDFEDDLALGRGHEKILTIDVPHMGLVEISSTSMKILPPRRGLSHVIETDVKVGGIGEISLGARKSISGILLPEVPTTTPDNTDWLTHDPTTAMEEWQFQELDTAFFDSLMWGLDAQIDSGVEWKA